MTGKSFMGFKCLFLGHRYRTRILYDQHGHTLIGRYRIQQCERCGHINTGRSRP
jgi:hypothetical protein